MNFLFRRMFWGIIIVLVGVLYLLNNIFGFNIPIWNVFWPVVIILIGVSFLSGRKGIKTESKIVFDEGDVKISDENRDYSTLFGKSTYDFRKTEIGKENLNIEVNTIFGSTNVLIDENTPMRIAASSAFGGIRFPNGNTVAFGEQEYTTKSYKKNAPYILVKANAVFGSIEISNS